MKKLVSILFFILLGSSSLFSQTTTGYVKVKWNTGCQACCLTMVYVPCITVVRIIDDYVVVENLCDTVSGSTYEAQFSFDMPQCTSNWDFKIYAAVWAGCPPSTLCCHEKNPGITRDCSDLEHGDVEIQVDF